MMYLVLYWIWYMLYSIYLLYLIIFEVCFCLL